MPATWKRHRVFWKPPSHQSCSYDCPCCHYLQASSAITIQPVRWQSLGPSLSLFQSAQLWLRAEVQAEFFVPILGLKGKRTSLVCFLFLPCSALYPALPTSSYDLFMGGVYTAVLMWESDYKHSLFFITCVPGMKRMPSGLVSKCPYPLSHLSCPWQF